MTMITFQTKAEKLREKLAERRAASSAIAIPDKCPHCGNYVCSCRCPDCSVCGGSGYIHVNEFAEPTHRDFGQVKPCPNSSRKMISVSAQSGFDKGGLKPDEYMQLDWKMVKPGFSDGIKARDAILKTYQHGSGLVFVFGNFGQAKTLSMKIAVAVALREGKRARYAKLTNVLDDIRTAYDEKERKMQALLDKIAEWRDLDLLALDEMDKAQESDWARDRIFNLIDDRYQLAVREEAITLMAGNYHGVDEVSGYLRSRIEDNRFSAFGSVVYVNGADGRKSIPSGWRF